VIGEGVRITVKDAIAAAVSAISDQQTGLGALDALMNDKNCDRRSGLLDAFNAVAAPMVRGSMSERVDPRRLVRWLAKHRDRVIGPAAS
jgi:hypothetical protein